MTAAAAVPAQRQGIRRAWVVAATGLGLLMILSETRMPSIAGELDTLGNAARFVVGRMLLWLALCGVPATLPFRGVGTVIGLAFAGCLVAAVVGGVAWPNSGDEYSYMFLADLLRHGRIAAEAPPDPALFESFHVLTQEGWVYSPYAPGWSALLAPFRAAGIEVLVNPLLTALLGAVLAGILAGSRSARQYAGRPWC